MQVLSLLSVVCSLPIFLSLTPLPLSAVPLIQANCVGMALRVGGALVLGAWRIFQVITVKVKHVDNHFLSTIELFF